MSDEKLVIYLANRLKNVCDHPCQVVIGAKAGCNKCNRVKKKIIIQALNRYYNKETILFSYNCECTKQCGKNLLISSMYGQEFNIWNSILYSNNRFYYKSCLDLTNYSY
jgi:hypothetical protein